MNWLEVQQLIESMQKNMDCPICLEIMKNPVTTICNHNFCNFCISKFLNTKRYVPCPMCKVLLSKRSLRENSKLQNIIDKAKKLVTAIETDTGWTYAPPTKNQTLQARRKRHKANSVKRKISLEGDNTELLDETNTKNTRFGKRRKSLDIKEKGKDGLCNESPSSGLTDLDTQKPSYEPSLEQCSSDKQEALCSVTPPNVLFSKERKNKCITEKESLSKGTKSKPSRNLQSKHTHSSSDSSGLFMNEKNQKMEALVDLARQIVHIDSLNIDSSECVDDPVVEVSRAENLTGRHSRCTSDNSVAYEGFSRSLQTCQTKEPSGSSQRIGIKEPSGSSQRIGTKETSGSSQRIGAKEPSGSSQRIGAKEPSGSSQRIGAKEPSGSSQRIGAKEPFGSSQRIGAKEPSGSSQRIRKKEPSRYSQRIGFRKPSGSSQSQKQITALKNLENRTNTIENSRKLSDHTLLDSISQDYHKNLENTSPMKTRGRIKCQMSFDKVTNSQTCVVFGKLLKKHATDIDSHKIVRVELSKGKKMVQETNARPCRKKCQSQETGSNVNLMCSVKPGIENLPKMKISRITMRNKSDLSPQSAYDVSDRENRFVSADSKKTNLETGPAQKIENEPCDRIPVNPDEIFGHSVPYSVLVWSSDSEDDMINIRKSVKIPNFKWTAETNNLKTYSRKHSSQAQKNHTKIARWLRLLPSEFSEVGDDPTLDENVELQDEGIAKSGSWKEPKTDQQKTQNSVKENSVSSGPDISVSQLENNSRVIEKEETTKCWEKTLSTKPENEKSPLGNGYQKLSENSCKNNVNLSLNSVGEKNSSSLESEKELDSSRITPENISDIQDTLEISDNFDLENIPVSEPTPKEAKGKGRFAELQTPVDGESVVENINPFEFLESPKLFKRSKRKKAKKPSRMPKLSFQNRLNRSFQKRLSIRNSPSNILLSAQNSPVQEELQDKCMQYLTAENSCEKEKETGVPYNNAKLTTDSRCSENSSKNIEPDGVILDVREILNEQATSGENCKSDGLNISNTLKTSKSRKELMEKPPDLELAEPFAIGNNRRKSVQRRRSKRHAKVDDKVSEELEILKMVNLLSSAEEHDFVFNSQDVCKSFNVSVDNQPLRNLCDKINNTCNQVNDKPGESVVQSDIVSCKGKSHAEDTMMIQKNRNENQMNNDPRTKDKNISLGSINNTRENIEEIDEGLSKTAGKIDNYENSNMNVAGTTGIVSSNGLSSEPGQKTCSRPQHKKDGVFVKPAGINILYRSKRSGPSVDSLKTDSQVSASTSSERKLVDAKTISSAKKHLQKQTSMEFLEARPSLKNCKHFKTIDLDPSVAIQEKISSGSRIETNERRENTMDLVINARSGSTNPDLERCPKTVTIDDKTFEILDSVPQSHFSGELGNCKKSEQCIDELKTSVMNADGRIPVHQLNTEESRKDPPASKNTRICKRMVPITPTVIPESPFPEMATSNPGSDVETPVLPPTALRNRTVQFSNQVSFIHRPRKFEKEEDVEGMNPEIPISVEEVGSLQNFGSVDLEYSTECDGDELETDNSKSESSDISSEVDGVSVSTLGISNTKRQDLAHCTTQVSEFQEVEQNLDENVDGSENVNFNWKKAEESDEDAVKTSRTLKSNLRFCGPTDYSITDNSEYSCEESVSVDTQQIESSSQRWMNEDILPLAEKTANQFEVPSSAGQTLDPLKTAAITTGENKAISVDRNFLTGSQQPLSVKMRKVDLSVQNQGKKNLELVTQKHVAHLPGNYHHLNDGHPFRDEGGTSAEKGSEENDNPITLDDDDSEGHSSGTEDLNINPDPSEFELPNLEIQPETVKKLLSDVGTTNLIRNGSPRLMYSTELDRTNENKKISAHNDEQNFMNSGPQNQYLENFHNSSRAKTSVGAEQTASSPDLRRTKNSSRKKTYVKNKSKLSSPSSQENIENLARSDQLMNCVSSEISSDTSSPKRNLGSEDEKPLDTFASPCQILCYSSEETTKESPKGEELSPRPTKPDLPISKASVSNVQIISNLRLVDYDVSQSSLLSETESDSAPSFTHLVGRRTRSSSRLQNQLSKSPKTCKSERRRSSQKAKPTNSNSLRDPKEDPAVNSEYSIDEILPPTAEKSLPSKEPDSLTSTVDSWITVLDNLDSLPILKTQGSTLSKTNDSIPEELILPKSGIPGNVDKNLTITESEIFLSTPERKFLISGVSEAEEFSGKTELKKQDATVSRTETDNANLMLEPAVVSSKRKVEALADCLPGNLDCSDLGKTSSLQGLNSMDSTESSQNTMEEAAVSSQGNTEALPGNVDFGAVAKSALQDINSLVQTLTESSENTLEEAVVSSRGNNEELAECLPGNSDSLAFDQAAKSVPQEVNSLAPTLSPNSENTMEADSQIGNTLEPTPLSNPNPLNSSNPSNFVSENLDIGATSKKQSVLLSETDKNHSSTVDIPDSEKVEKDSLRVDIPDTEFCNLEPVVSLTDSVIPESVEPIPATQEKLQNDDIPKLLTSNENMSQHSTSSYVPCSVEQDGSLAHVLGAFRDVYTRNHNTALSEKVCDGAGLDGKDTIKRTADDLPGNSQGNSKRSLSLITKKGEISISCRLGDKGYAGDETIPESNNIRDNPQQVGDDLKKSPLFPNPSSVASSSILNSSKIAFSTECHLMIDSQNFIPVKRSKRKCFSLGGCVPESPTKTKEGNEAVKSSASSTGILANIGDAKNLDVKTGTKGLQFSPTFTENSHQARRDSLSKFNELEKEENRKLEGVSRISPEDNSIFEGNNSPESCVLLPISQFGEIDQAVTLEKIPACSPKQNLQEEQIPQSVLPPDKPSLGLVSKQERSKKKSSKISDLTDNTLTGLSPKSGNKDVSSNSHTEEPVYSQQSVSSCDSTNENCGLRSSSRLRGRNKAASQEQNKKGSLEKVNTGSVPSENQELQRKCLFRNPDSSKEGPEPLSLSPTGSDTQQPSCPFSSAEDMEVESAVVCDLPNDDKNTAATEEPSLDFSELDRITYSPQGQSVEPMLELEKDHHEPQENLKKNDYDSVLGESMGKDKIVGNILEMGNEEVKKMPEDSQNGATSSASTKCPSAFSENPASTPGSQGALSNPTNIEIVETDRLANIGQKSKSKKGQDVSSIVDGMEISGKKAIVPGSDSANGTELGQKTVKERSVGDGFTIAETKEHLTTKSGIGPSQDKDDPIDDVLDLSLPDIPSSFTQGFNFKTNADRVHNNVSIQLKHPEEVPDAAETLADEKIPEDKDLKSNSSKNRSQEKRGSLQKTRISNSDSEQAVSCAVKEDTVIVIDGAPSGKGEASKLDEINCNVPTVSAQSKDVVIIAHAEAETSNEQSMLPSGNTVDKNLSNKSDNIGRQQSIDEDEEDSEDISRQRKEKPRRQVINDDSDDDDDDEQVEITNPESIPAVSPSTLSTQNEKFSTQQCTHLEQDLEEMKKQIAQLEARLGLNDSAVDLVSEEDADLQVTGEQKLPALAERNLPPEGVVGKSKKVIKGQASDQKYVRLSSSSDDDDDDVLERKVIPDSDPDEKSVEPNTSSIFPVRKGTVTDVHSSGEESEDLFCTPGTPIALPQLPPSRHKQPENATEEPHTESLINKNTGKHLDGKRKRNRKNGTHKTSRLRIESSSSEDEDIEIPVEDPRSKMLHSKVKAKENKRARTSGILENEKEDRLKKSAESSCASAKNSPRSPRKSSRTLPKVKPTVQNELSSPVLKELSVANTTEINGKKQPLSSQSPGGCQEKDLQLKKTKCFIATGLSNVEVNQVRRLAAMIGGKFVFSFSGDVTHVIVKTVSEKVRYCDRTLKYFLGIANKSWILSLKWIQDSLEQKRLLKEDEYEIIGDSVNGFAHRGPTRSRLSQTALFVRFEIYVVGESSELPQDELKSLVKMAGGRVVSDPDEFSSEPCITCLAIAGSNQSLKDFRRLKGQMKIYNILLVSREWILDSVAMYRVQPLEGYIQLS